MGWTGQRALWELRWIGTVICGFREPDVSGVQRRRRIGQKQLAEIPGRRGADRADERTLNPMVYEIRSARLSGSKKGGGTIIRIDDAIEPFALFFPQLKHGEDNLPIATTAS